MNDKNGVQTKSNPKMKSITGTNLAKLLDVAPPSLSGAAKNEHRCKGYPVAKWANRDANGKLEAYQVPEEIYRKLSGKEERKNPSDQEGEQKKNFADHPINKNKKNIKEPDEEADVESKQVERSNPVISHGDDSSWTEALFAAFLGIGAMYLGEYISTNSN